MIVTLTPNPSFDRTVVLDELVVGGVHRATSDTLEAGGKGINVARALANAGHQTHAIYPAHAGDADKFGALLASIDGLSPAPMLNDGPIRTNVSIVDKDGTTTKVNAAGSALTPARQDELIEACVAACADAEWLVASGSLPPGVDADFYVRLVAAVAHLEVRTAIDSSGAALAQAALSHCDVLKPNHLELAELVGRPLPTLGDVVDAADEVRDMGIGQVVVSLGSAGAVLVGSDGHLFVSAPPAAVANTVGAGDAMLSGFVHGGPGGEQALRTAVAWGSAAVESPTTAFAIPGAIALARVESTREIDRSIRMEDL